MVLKYIVDFQEKVQIFNSFFADQCAPIWNGSVLPSELPLRTDNTLSTCHFAKEDILRINNNLDPNKAHGHDAVSIPMLKTCGDSIWRPLNIRVNLRTGKFPLEWKKANIVPIHKKGDNQAVNNYRPVSLLPFVVKYLKDCFIMKCLIFFRKWFNIPKTVGFRPQDSCINQLLSIIHDILSALDIGLEVRVLFLDVSKVFDKVWHAGLIYKLCKNSICGDLINTLISWPT